jgi:hypothetical protein
MKERKKFKSYLFTLTPSTKTSPFSGSYNLSIKFTVVLFPHPDSPTNATFFPGSITKLRPSNIFLLVTSEG